MVNDFTNVSLNSTLDSNLNIQAIGADSVQTSNTYGAWGYWQDWYYPNTIIHSYPVYLQERALDKGKQAFEIIKILKDKKLVNLTKVADFIDLMDELIKIL